jgi:uncharacterized protein (DUF2147 family)
MKYLLLLFFVQLSIGQNVEGYWKTIDEDGKEKSIVKIYKTEDGTLEGVIDEILDPEKKDFVCVKCKGDKKDKPLEGLKIIENMKPEDDEWKDGTITDPNNGKTYDCKLWLDEDNKSVLNVRGYVGFFYRTQNWQKVDKP